MKKISNSIRIGMVPRAEIPAKLHGEYSTSNVQQPINHQSMREQINPQNSYAGPGVDAPLDHHQMAQFTSPNNIRLHEMNDGNSNKQQTNSNGQNHYHNLPPTRPRQETVSELFEVPSKAKSLTTKKVLLGVTVAVVIGAIVIGVVLAVVLTRPKDAATASTSPPTTITSANISIVWPFDNTATDLNNVYNGSAQNGATYSNGIPINVPYFGSGQALSLNGVNQFVSIPLPFLPLNFTSFTIEAWIYPTAVTNDRGIFGHCQCSTCANQCLYFICRGNRVFIDFTMNDLYGSTTLVINTWYHVAFVYNYQTQQQILYVNGIQDAIKSNAAPYQAVNASIQIGATQAFATTNFFNGYIDNVWVTTRAKSSDEILRDASLMVYYSFDLPNQNADSGPNKILGNSTNIITVNGRVNQAIRFVGLSSFFQSFGLSPVPAGVFNNRPFSVSLWINPTISGSCSFVQFFTITPARCANFLGIFSNGGSTGQIFVQSTNIQTILTGPFIRQNIWTHISVTYDSVNGYSLYSNGIYFGTANGPPYTWSGTLTSLYVGYHNACSGVQQNSPCQGSVDEVYIHNRELTQLEVTVLANP